MTDPEVVLAFWFGGERDPIDGVAALEGRSASWFHCTPERDHEIAQRFGETLEEARHGELDGWAESARGRLGLILLLDQFSRHVFRGTPLCFAQDAAAQRLTLAGLDAEMDRGLALHERLFFVRPLLHAEDRALQERHLLYSEHMVGEAAVGVRSFYERAHAAAQLHHDVVARFGRFPTRNAVLGRAPTPEEITYLEELKITGAYI